MSKDPQLAYTLVTLLTNGRSIDPDFKEAQFWANKLNLDRKRLPYGIDDAIEDLSFGHEDNQPDENWDEPKSEMGKFYSLSLPRDRIRMVDSQPAFRDFLSVLAQQVCV